MLQINGKVRGALNVAHNAPAALIEKTAVAHEVVERWHTQQRAASAWGVEQWGHRQTGMRGS